MSTPTPATRRAGPEGSYSAAQLPPERRSSSSTQQASPPSLTERLWAAFQTALGRLASLPALLCAAVAGGSKFACRNVALLPSSLPHGAVAVFTSIYGSLAAIFRTPAHQVESTVVRPGDEVGPIVPVENQSTGNEAGAATTTGHHPNRQSPHQTGPATSRAAQGV